MKGIKKLVEFFERVQELILNVQSLERQSGKKYDRFFSPFPLFELRCHVSGVCLGIIH